MHLRHAENGVFNLVFKKMWPFLTEQLKPILWVYLRYRRNRGKESQHRVKERKGYASLPRPSCERLIWFHAISVGETLAFLPLVTELRTIDKHIHFLITTGTQTSAHIVEKFINEHQLQAYASHQFVPWDVKSWVERFLTYWQPALGIFIESELWPNLILSARARDIPLLLLNARLSDKTLRLWKKIPFLMRPLLAQFEWIAARSREDAKNLASFGTFSTLIMDLKQAAHPLSFNIEELRALKTHLNHRPVWIAASTHMGEEEEIIAAHTLLLKTYPSLLCIIIPRHPERGKRIAHMAHHAPQRSLAQLPDKGHSFWIGDTIGEMGLYLQLSSLVFIGNSLTCGTEKKKGGHNPLEAAQFHACIASGPHIANFRENFVQLKDSVTFVDSAKEIAQWVENHLDILSASASCPLSYNTPVKNMSSAPSLHHLALQLYQSCGKV